MFPLFGRQSRPIPDSEPVGIIPNPATVELIQLRIALDSLTSTALLAGVDCDLAMDVRRAAKLPMTGLRVRPAVPVVPGPGGEGGAR
jgi:hypothetical protein